MRRRVEAESHSLTLHLAATFTPTEDLFHEGQRAQELTVRIFERTQGAGAIRRDLVVDDLSFIFEQLAAVRLRDAARTLQLRRRYLALVLESLRANGKEPLPGPAPNWREIAERWET